LPAAGPEHRVAGFLRHDGTDFHAYATTESPKIRTSSCFQRQQLTFIVVLDNATTGGRISGPDSGLGKPGALTLFYLPPYGRS
jgi:hypothetical protein